MKSGLKNRWLSLIAVVAVSLSAVSAAQAEQLTFTIDPAQSSLMLTEIFQNTLGVPLFPQEAGVSDIAQQIGEIIVDVDDPLGPSTIEFMGSDISFIDNGNWLPDFGGGVNGDPRTPQAGAYGTQFIDAGLGVTFYSVFRDSITSLVMYDESDFGDPIVPDPIPVTAGSFPWDDVNSRVLVDVLGGSWDWNLGGSFGDDFDSEDIDDTDNLNIATTNGTYAVSVGGNVATLTIPFHARLGEDPTGFPGVLLAVFQGTLVATTVIGQPGDFDDDGDVDADDFLEWQTGFGTIYDGDDFLVWQQNFPTPGGGTGSGAVPEPASLALLAVMAFAIASMRKWLG